ncbi:hypothetical protein Ahy_B03g062801 [Arachis hypogaea]|uniref:Nucleolar protein 10 n=1 Tax=Arachis hypogaea TaxID=3818 RepID=A0A444ZVC6_ARAHY|nr:hypothetical protein Ahy_B03g062801 [Arachis hypogaea]
MYLQFYINDNGDKVYTTKKETPLGLATQSAHPARFSPDDKYSRQRVLLKKRFGLLPTQQPPPKALRATPMLRNRVPLLIYGDSITIGVKRKRGLFTGIRLRVPLSRDLQQPIKSCHVVS